MVFKDNITPFQNKKTITCPICKKQTSKKNYPFCSNRCSDIDLGKWFEGKYVISEDLNNDNLLSDFNNSEDKPD